jgi:hypothetical protein
MTEELPPPQAAARTLKAAMSSQAVWRNGCLGSSRFMDVRDANGDEYEMDAMGMSKSQLILAELRRVHEVNS